MRPVRFGTDGIRGLAGEWPLTAEGAFAIGGAVARWSGGPVVVGWDTRESSPMLAEGVLDGIAAAGAVGLRAGVLPTPALSCAVVGTAAAGVMITASHNLWEDNGVKVVGADGSKVFDPAPIEAAIGAPARSGGRVEELPDAASTWRALLPHPDLHGQSILIDCAHGAATDHAPAFLESLGARVTRRGCAPNGHNINDGVGALHPPSAISEHLAICLDGDGDRVALFDSVRGLLDGDDLLYFLAEMEDGPVVGTVMTNGGLEKALGAGRLVRAPVGDRFVAEAMRSSGAAIGGEPSGHLLFADGLPTSCGLYTALRALAVPWRDKFHRLPQVTRNVRATEVGAAQEIAAAERSGHRVIVRKSGTEPVVRVMVEGEDAAHWADTIAAAIDRR
jgi:phosphoglucosamine mutase